MTTKHGLVLNQGVWLRKKSYSAQFFWIFMQKKKTLCKNTFGLTKNLCIPRPFLQQILKPDIWQFQENLAQSSPDFSKPTVFTALPKDIWPTTMRASGPVMQKYSTLTCPQFCLSDIRKSAVNMWARKTGVTFEILLIGDDDCLFIVCQQ